MQRLVSEQSGRWNLLRHRAGWSICLSGDQTNWRISSPKWTRLRAIGLPSFITTERWYRNSQSGNSSGSSSSMPFITEASFQHTCARWALPCPLSMARRRTADRCNQRVSCRFATLRAVGLKRTAKARPFSSTRSSAPLLANRKLIDGGLSGSEVGFEEVSWHGKALDGLVASNGVVFTDFMDR